MGVNINTKPTVTTIDNNDQIFISDDGVALKKISYTDLAKAIIEQYNASQLAGSAKTVQTAINALNSNMNNFPSSGNRLHYYGSETVTISEIRYEWALAKGTDAPDNTNFWYIHTFVYSVDSSGHITNGRQIAYGYLKSKKDDVYDRYCSGGTWYDWVKRPTRNEMDDLNSKGQFHSLQTSANESESLREKGIISGNGYYRLIAFTRTAKPSCASEYFFLTGGTRSAILSPITEGTNDAAPILTNECILKLRAQETNSEVFYCITKI